MKHFLSLSKKILVSGGIGIALFLIGHGTAYATWTYTPPHPIPYVVDVPPINQVPIVDAGPDQALGLPTSSTSLTGSATDPDGIVVYTMWQFVSGPATPSISATTGNENPSTVTVSGMVASGIYVFRFNAEDNQNAWGSDDVQVTISAAGSPSGTLSASDCSIVSGGSSCSDTVSWTTQNLTANPTAITRNTGSPASFTPSPLASGSQSATLGYGQTTFYLYHNGVLLGQAVATASCASGSSWDGSTCVVIPPVPPSVILNASPATVYSGNAATLSWTTAGVTSCTASASPASTSWVGVRGTASVYPHESTGALTTTTTFTLSCTGPNGSADSSKTVTVVPLVNPTTVAVTLVADPEKIAAGDSSTLSWLSSNATSCSGIGFDTGGVLSGSVSVSPTANTTYTITCRNGTDTASDQATVLIKRKFLFIEF